MKKEERLEYNYIKKSFKTLFKPCQGNLATIRTNASSEYKHALDDFYTRMNFHPASVCVDKHLFDENERIIYVFGRTWFDNDMKFHSWIELYTSEERERFAAALD